jgi:hypothetical protein
MENGTSVASSGLTNGGNMYDNNWATYGSFGIAGSYLMMNYSMGGMKNVTVWTYRDDGTAAANLTVPQNCWGSTLQFKVTRPTSTATAYYYCYNYVNYSWTLVTSHTLTYTYRFYEENVTAFQNNSLTRVMPFGLTNCSTGGEVMYNFEVRDEDTNALIVANYTQQFYLTYLGTTYGYAFTGTDDQWSICKFPASLVAEVNSNEQYVAPGYNTRTYHIIGGTTAGVTDYTRYLGLGTTDYTFRVKDQFGNLLSGVAIVIEKYNFITMSWVTVGSAVTDITGTAVFYLTPLDNYRVTASKTGYTTNSFAFTPGAVYLIDIILTQGSGFLPSPDPGDYMWNDVTIGYSPTEGYYSTMQNLSFFVFSNSSSIDYFGMVVIYYSNSTSLVVYNSTVTTAHGGGTFQYTTTANGTYRVQGWFKHYNYSLYTAPFNIYYINTNVTGLAKVKEIFETEEPLSGWAFYALLLVIAMVGAGFISRYSMEGAGVVALAILWFGSLMYPSVCIAPLFDAAMCLTPIHITILTTIVTAGAFLAVRGLL